MINSLLAVTLIDGPLPIAFTVVSAALCVYLLARPPRRRWLLTVLAALLAAATLSVLAWFIVVRIDHAFTAPIDHAVYFWFAATIAGTFLAIASLWRSSRWRKGIAAVAMVVFLITGTLNINAGFGIDRTVGDFIGVLPSRPVTLPPRLHSRPGEGKPLWKTWKPPADMPTHGEVGTQVIPNTVSGFVSRPAGIYLPPAALVPGAPPLPLVILTMGQPGSPDPQYAAAILDQFASRHGGLAPIVIVPDQLGDPNQDTLCLDTPQFGNVETFLSKDVVNWVTENLNVIHDHRYWTIAGYSNGGQCAISLMAKYPRLWSNVLDVSGEEFPGAEWSGDVLTQIFHGDQAAYDRQKPINMLSHEKLPGTFGVFTAGSDDSVYVTAQQRVAAAARGAGMSAVSYEVPNGGHVMPALTDGLAKGFQLLYPRLGLSPGLP